MKEFAKDGEMHGSIIVLLKRFIESRHNYSTWVKILEENSIPRVRTPYRIDQNYPIGEIYAILQAGSRLENVNYQDYLEQFGEFLVPDLLLVFNKYVRPEWRPYDLLLFVEDHLHGAARRDLGGSNPPVLNIMKVGKDTMFIDYFSKRRMAGLGIGIVRGIATYYNESDRIQVVPTTPRDAERVQIKVTFI